MCQVSKRLERVFEATKAWPLHQQEAAADVLERMDDLARKPYLLSADERADLEEALQEASRGEFASDAEVTAMFARHWL